MTYKITEKLVPGGLSGHETRSCVVDIPEGQEVPEGATETTDTVRDWQNDPKETE